jgi:exosome complex exonuclease DIS3/RRP44
LSLSLSHVVLKSFFHHLAEDEEEDVHLVPSSADDAPRTTNLGQGSAGDTNAVSSRPSGCVVGIIKRNWHS